MPMQKIEQQNFITKKIGSTYYIVSVRCSDQAKETFNDKLLRLVKADTAEANSKEVVNC
jgi:hypothetical protein